MQIPLDRGALAAIFDLARNSATSPGTLKFIEDHAGRLDTFLNALEQEAKRLTQAQGEGEKKDPAG